MKVANLKLKGLKLVSPDVHTDVRGFLFEAFNRRTFRDAGIDFSLKQHNLSCSRKGVVRGLHFQWNKPLGKLTRAVSGRAFFVAVDIRHRSPTRGKWVAVELSKKNRRMLWAPAGFATGFYAYEDGTELEYYYSAFFNPKGESNIIWNDSDLNIKWPVKKPILSERDAKAPALKEWLKSPNAKRL
jgi:dTDP-4-dehydrorhamnose 3,5-epimerase